MTIHHRLRSSPEFKAAIDNARCEYAAVLSDDMCWLSATALKSLRKLLEAPDTPAADRLKLNGALAVLERPHFLSSGWHLPERTESPREQEVLETLPEVEAEEARAAYGRRHRRE